MQPLLEALRALAAPLTAGVPAVWLVHGLALLALLLVYAPLAWRLRAVARLRRRLRSAWREGEAPDERALANIGALFARSPLQEQWRTFASRWRRHCERLGTSRAPLRFAEVLAEQPLLPRTRASLLSLLPLLFVAAGAVGATLGLHLESATGRGDLLLARGLERIALPCAWGLAAAVLALVAARWLEGRATVHGEALDTWLASLLPPLSAAELEARGAELGHREVRELANELASAQRRLSAELTDAIERLERSTADAANLISKDQREAVRAVVEELNAAMQAGVEEHVGALREALDRAAEHQDAIGQGLERTFERLAENAVAHQHVCEALDETSRAVQACAGALVGSASELSPALATLRDSARALEDSGERLAELEGRSRRALELSGSALDRPARALAEWEETVGRITHALGEERRALEALRREPPRAAPPPAEPHAIARAERPPEPGTQEPAAGSTAAAHEDRPFATALSSLLVRHPFDDSMRAAGEVPEAGEHGEASPPAASRAAEDVGETQRGAGTAEAAEQEDARERAKDATDPPAAAPESLSRFRRLFGRARGRAG